MSQASQVQMNEFVKVVDDFMQNYSRLISPATRADVYATGNPAIISDYESAVTKGRALKTTIEATVGVWSAAKRAYASVTDITSMYIGDAVDWIKNLFTDENGVNGLGAVQVPAAIWVTGIIGSAYLLNSLMTKIFVSIEASKIQRQNPGVSRERALEQAKTAVASGLFGAVNWPLIAGGVLIVLYFFGRKR